MKLFSLVAAASAWEQPKYWDAMTAARTKISGWGYPIGVKAAADATMCPEMALPAGAASISYDGSTAMIVCQEGYQSVGRRRTKCRFKPNRGFYWKTTLAGCTTCEDTYTTEIHPDSGITTECSFVGKKAKKTCFHTCPSGSLFNGRKRTVKSKCKCSRRNNGCSWIVKAGFPSFGALTCLNMETGVATPTLTSATSTDMFVNSTAPTITSSGGSNVNGVSAVVSGTGTSTSTDGTVISSVVGVTAAPSTNETIAWSTEKPVVTFPSFETATGSSNATIAWSTEKPVVTFPSFETATGSSNVTVAVSTEKPLLTMPVFTDGGSTGGTNATLAVTTDKPVVTMPFMPTDTNSTAGSNSTLAVTTDKPIVTMPMGPSESTSGSVMNTTASTGSASTGANGASNNGANAVTINGANCCTSFTYTRAGTTLTFSQSSDLVNEGWPVYQAQDSTLTMWWMWHADVGHWVVNDTPGAHGNDITKSSFGADMCPEAITSWDDTETVTITCA